MSVAGSSPSRAPDREDIIISIKTTPLAPNSILPGNSRNWSTLPGYDSRSVADPLQPSINIFGAWNLHPYCPSLEAFSQDFIGLRIFIFYLCFA